MVDFCSDDERLLGVGIVPLDDPEYALAEAEWAIDNGLKAIWVPHRLRLTDLQGTLNWSRFGKYWLILIRLLSFMLEDHLYRFSALGVTTEAATKDWMGGGENVRTGRGAAAPAT